MASRRKGRILAFQALYFWEANKVPAEELISFSWVDEKKISLMDESILIFSKNLICGTIENINEIDNVIQKHLDHWDISRLNRVDLAILRISAYALMFQNDIPQAIVIDEAIGICKEFGTEESYKFVNGILDSIGKYISANIKKG